MKPLIALMLCLLSAVSHAEESMQLDGNWIKRSIDAYDRVHVTRNGTSEDASDSLMFAYYVAGMLTVHRQNNLVVSMMVVTLTDSNKAKQKNTVVSSKIDKQLRTALAFAPLLGIPDTITTQQIFAIIRNYLDAHPEKWGNSASVLITSALEEAFSKK